MEGGGIYPIHGAYLDKETWCIAQWTGDGSFTLGHPDSWRDLVSAKTWRAWEEGEAPVRIMLRQKGFAAVESKRTKDCDLPTLFIHYIRVHEDGTETPCGVEVGS